MVKIVTFCSFLCKEYIEIIKCIAIFKVVDKVWHDGIIFKLKQSGISDNTLNLLYNFLIIRAQKVVLKGQASSLAHVTAWVPKGSTFGPVLVSKRHKRSRWWLIKWKTICRWHFIIFCCLQFKHLIRWSK